MLGGVNNPERAYAKRSGGFAGVGALQLPGELKDSSSLLAAESNRSHALMKKYRDLPMDLADATLVAAAEERGLSRIFTLDTDFRVYRLKGRKPFELVPRAEMSGRQSTHCATRDAAAY